MNIGVFCCDPGGSSGVAWAILDPSAATEVAFRERQNAGSTTVSGDARTQVNELAQLWRSDAVYEPAGDAQWINDKYEGWKRAVARARNWER